MNCTATYGNAEFETPIQNLDSGASMWPAPVIGPRVLIVITQPTEQWLVE